MLTPIPVLGFAAYSGTGKTTLLKQLIPLLAARGLRVGVVKHAHHDFDMDTPGKDSYELREAGASQVLVASHKRWVLTYEKRRSAEPALADAVGHLCVDELDLVLVEGFKHESFAKIELHRPSVGKPPLYPGDPNIIAVVTDGAPPVATELTLLDINRPDAVADFVLGWLRGSAVRGDDPRRDLVRYYRWLRQYGYNDSHSGNASVRDEDGFWVTPTGACADTLSAADLVRCPLHGACPDGASLDAPLHQMVYQRNTGAGAVLHSHGPHSVAVTLNGRDFSPVDFEGQYYFDRIPVISIPYDRYLEQAPDRVASALTSHKIAVVRGHGVYARAENLNLAYKWTCSLESSAKTYSIARQLRNVAEV